MVRQTWVVSLWPLVVQPTLNLENYIMHLENLEHEENYTKCFLYTYVNPLEPETFLKTHTH